MVVRTDLGNQRGLGVVAQHEVASLDGVGRRRGEAHLGDGLDLLGRELGWHLERSEENVNTRSFVSFKQWTAMLS